AQVAPSVVTVETVGGQSPRRSSAAGPGIPGLSESGGRFRVGAGPTTGLVFRGDGLILTSTFTFARDPAVITITLADGRQFAATLVARDEIRRLALLKIEAADLPVPMWVDDEDDIHVGQSAIAVGRGFGSSRAGVSLGVVSGLRRMGGNAVQTDARLSPANYGGPLIDLRGHVVGLIVPMSYSAGELAGIELYDSGIGFAVPAWHATPSAQRLAHGENIVRGVLGVRIGPGAVEGLSIVDVIAGSPAQAAGIEAGDELTAIDDAPVRDPAELARRMAFRAAGEAVALTVRRGGRPLHLDAILADPANLGPEARPREAESPPP
ncbi:MAG: trypsin-like peptidase domain-containing protein, partial [Phycisphaerae bacterium]|nr:trypsin-like peptidase domain-containing protein [Phycisphaerae bacterium]